MGWWGEMNTGLLDTIELTARLRRLPGCSRLRSGFEQVGVKPDLGILVTLDGTGPDCGEGVLVTRLVSNRPTWLILTPK